MTDYVFGKKCFLDSPSPILQTKRVSGLLTAQSLTPSFPRGNQSIDLTKAIV